MWQKVRVIRGPGYPEDIGLEFWTQGRVTALFVDMATGQTRFGQGLTTNLTTSAGEPICYDPSDCELLCEFCEDVDDEDFVTAQARIPTRANS